MAKYNHTDKIVDRRKALFPSDDADSDLGHMSPLNTDSNSNFSTTNHTLEPCESISERPFRSFNKANIDDYVICDTDDESCDYMCSTPRNGCKLGMEMSPMQQLMSLPILYSPNQTMSQSPTSKLQTPHDMSTFKSNCKQAKRKLLELELVVDEELDTSLNKSRVRTALFPADENVMALPAKSFYPKENQRLKHSPFDLNKEKKQLKHKIKPLYLCNRRNKARNRFGQINAGVRHKIKKPKQKFAKSGIIKAALNIMENSPLNEYLEKMALIKTDFVPKQIKPIINEANKATHKQIKPIINETNKENATYKQIKPTINELKQMQTNQNGFGENMNTFENVTNKQIKPTNNEHKQMETNQDSLYVDEKINTLENVNKKFFKSSRSRGVVTINKQIKLEVKKSGKMHLIGSSWQKSPKGKLNQTNFESNESEETINIDINKQKLPKSKFNHTNFESNESYKPIGFDINNQNSQKHKLNQACFETSENDKTIDFDINKHKLHKRKLNQTNFESNESYETSIDINKQKSPKRKYNQDSFEINESEETIDIDINKILTSLSTGDDPTNALKKAELMLSPTSQMCDMASVWAINSPKRAKLNINALLDDSYKKHISASALDDATMEQKQKLFPLFCAGNIKVMPKEVVANRSVSQAGINDRLVAKEASKSVSQKRFKTVGRDQMILDAGQKRFGVTHCAECDSMYTMGDPAEELMHSNLHNGVHILKFNGWKNENVVYESQNSRIIKINAGDSKAWLKRVKDVLDFINRDFGVYETKEHSQVFFYIRNKTIIGCLVADPRDVAYRMSTTNKNMCCTQKPYPIKCGVSRIWVSPNHRKQGVATAMMHALRANFMFGNILQINDIALSSPTEIGQLFATKFFKTDNYLIYF